MVGYADRPRSGRPHSPLRSGYATRALWTAELCVGIQRERLREATNIAPSGRLRVFVWDHTKWAFALYVFGFNSLRLRQCTLYCIH